MERKEETMTLISYDKCPLCKSGAIKKRFACIDNFATGESFDVYECADCGLAFTQGIPDEKEIDRYYESPTYISHSNTSKGIVNSTYHLVRKLMLRNKARLVERLTLLKNGKILDYGAGTGHFARVMVSKGWDVTAIEKNCRARELALSEFGFRMHPVEALADIKERELDVVTMWHVMEHIQEPDKMWNQLYRILDDTGIAVIAVPNSISYDAQRYREHWAAYDVPRHLWHFTPSTIVRWGEKHGFNVKLIDYLDGDEAGLKSASILIEGENAYGYLKSEMGVHRLVRISPFDSSGRRHTSFAALEVMPEITDDVEVEVRTEDLKVDTYRASGAGGQHVNKTESAIRITHIPTGIVVACQNERSQHQNREVAMRMLKSKLIEIKERENLEKIEDIKGEQKLIEWGSQIRSYVFMPYTLAKDHRTGFENGNIGAVMDGDIDGFINAYLTQMASQGKTEK